MELPAQNHTATAVGMEKECLYVESVGTTCKFNVKGWS